MEFGGTFKKVPRNFVGIWWYFYLEKSHVILWEFGGTFVGLLFNMLPHFPVREGHFPVVYFYFPPKSAPKSLIYYNRHQNATRKNKFPLDEW